MLSTDPSHLRKYLTTLGIAVTAGTISLCGLFLRLQDDLTISQEHLRGLTPNARDTIEKRQSYLEWVTAWLPLFLLLGCAIGLGMTIYGLLGWAKRQRVIDELEDLSLDRSRAELRQMTDAERVAVVQNQAEVALDESGDQDRGSPSRQARLQALTARTVDAELELGMKLEALFGPTARIDLGVELVRGRQRQQVDYAVTIAEKVFVFELKYVANAKNVRSAVTGGVTQAVAAASMMSGFVTPIVILIVADELDLDLTDVRSHAEQVSSTFTTTPRVLVYREAEFASISLEGFGADLGWPHSSDQTSQQVQNLHGTTRDRS